MPSGTQKNRRGLKKYGLRKCIKCKNVYKLDNDHFYKNNAKGQGGFGWFCKDCKRDVGRMYYKTTNLKDRFEFLKKFNFTCQYCGRKAPEVVFHVDHIFPLSKGGDSSDENLTLACDECNIGKGDKLI